MSRRRRRTEQAPNVPALPIIGGIAGLLSRATTANAMSLIGGPDGRGPRILVAAADTVARDRLRRVLASTGCRVEVISDVDTGIIGEICDTPDMIVAEAPLLRRLSVANRASHHLPVILLSGASGDAARLEAAEAGADDYLINPFGARELLSRIGLHLAMARVGREATEAVRASERRLADVLEAIGEAVYAMDRDERILFANRKALEWWGLSADSVIGRPLLEVFPGIENRAPYQAYRQALADRQAVHLETTAPALGDRWIGLDVYPAPEGGLVVAFRDIDERKRAEARLRESEERFRLMLETLPDIAFVIDPDGMAQYYNQQMRNYVGIALGRAPEDRSALHPPEDRNRIERARARGFASGKGFIIEVRLRRHDGVYRWHRMRNRPVVVDGKIAFWLGTAVDIDDMREANALLERRVAERTAELEAANRHLATQIDERERAEAQLRQVQRVEAVGRLTSGVAHDFNNLLTAIIGNLELLAGRLGGSDERIARPLAGAAAAAERGARLTAQLLAFSRQQRMSPKRVDLNRIVDSMGTLLQSTIDATIGIQTVLSDRLWPALADAGQIELVLLNLAINARDAMPGGGDITIATRNATLGPPQGPEEPAAGDYAMVSVADTGTGISAEILDRVFEPFFTTKDVGKGSGLGLSQVLGVAQQLGGGVRINTRPGEGTRIEVFLPRARRADAAVRHGLRDRKSASHRGRERILLVDDDDDVRTVAAAMLAEAGYHIVDAGSGGAALDCLEREGDRIRLMIADIAMPGMSGVELAHAARLGRPDLPILFVTGFGGSALAAGDASLGEVLHKPFRSAELAAKVASVLSLNRRLRRSNPAPAAAAEQSLSRQ